MVLFIWNLLIHAWGARYIYKSLLSSPPLSTTGISSPPGMHMLLQMSLLEIKHFHPGENEIHREQSMNSFEPFIWRRTERKEKITQPYSFTGLIAALWMHTGWKWGRNHKHSCRSCSKIRQEICVGIKGLKLSEVNGKIETDSSVLWIKPLTQKCALGGEVRLVHGYVELCQEQRSELLDLIMLTNIFSIIRVWVLTKAWVLLKIRGTQFRIFRSGHDSGLKKCLLKYLP